MNSVRSQNIAELGGRLSVLTRQKLDHDRLDQLLKQLAETPAGAQGEVLRPIYRLVFSHAFAEEAVLWPVLRRVLPDGHELTLQVEREHQQINEHVRLMEATEPGSPERDVMLERFVGLLQLDVGDEEDVLLPRLQHAVSTNQLRLVGIAWEAVRRTAPTRAHPIVSRRPPGNVLAALPLSILDRSRDGMEAFLQSAGPVAPVLRRLDSALNRASHAAERLPGLKRGEDPKTHLESKPLVRGRTAAVVSVGVAALAGLALASRRKRAAHANG